MPRPVIEIENVSKFYRPGYFGRKTLRDDIQVWWANLRGRENPLLSVGETSDPQVNKKIVWALRDINLQVRQGEILGIIGANGAGKSTLLKIMSRITSPSTGEIRIKGRTGSLLEVGTGFHFELTGRENVFLNGAILGLRRAEIENRFDEIVEFADVGQYIDTPIKRYSSGMLVRLGFAVAAHLDPEIMIVDEVLSIGDIEFQQKSLEKIGGVAGEGRTVLFVSHNMETISSLCPKAVFLSEGRIVCQGETETVIQAYLSSVPKPGN